MFAGAVHAVEEVPQLGALVFGVPLAKLVAEAEEAFLGARLFLVPTGATHGTVKLELSERVQEGHRLQAVAAGVDPLFFLDLPGIDRRLHAAHDQVAVDLLHPPVAVFDCLLEVVPSVDVHQREGDLAGIERLAGKPAHEDRVLAAGEEHHRPLKLGGNLANDVDRLGLELIERRELISGAGAGRFSHRLSFSRRTRNHGLWRSGLLYARGRSVALVSASHWSTSHPAARATVSPAAVSHSIVGANRGYSSALPSATRHILIELPAVMRSSSG